MTVYHIDWCYDNHDRKKYYVSPYSLNGVLHTYFGFDFKRIEWKISYHPWYERFIGFFKWLRRSYITEKKAQKIADKLNKRQII